MHRNVGFQLVEPSLECLEFGSQLALIHGDASISFPLVGALAGLLGAIRLVTNPIGDVRNVDGGKGPATGSRSLPHLTPEGPHVRENVIY